MLKLEKASERFKIKKFKSPTTTHPTKNLKREQSGSALGVAVGVDKQVLGKRIETQKGSKKIHAACVCVSVTHDDESPDSPLTDEKTHPASRDKSPPRFDFLRGTCTGFRFCLSLHPRLQNQIRRRSAKRVHPHHIHIHARRHRSGDPNERMAADDDDPLLPLQLALLPMCAPHHRDAG
jgi:hypothetical protein